MKRLRSILYAPGNNQRLIEKSATTDADGLCFVLEDSVPIHERDAARATVRLAIADLASPRQPIYIKVNKPEPGHEPGALGEDLDAIVQPGLAGIVVPGVSHPSEIEALDSLLDAAERDAQLRPGSVEILLLIETPRAVIMAHELALTSTRIATLACGAAANGDLAGALGLEATRAGTERLYVMSKVLVDARAAGLHSPLDGVWGGIGDIDGLTEEILRARHLGYRGKLAIHPEQIEVINRLYSPSADEVARQRRIIEAFEEALADGKAATVVDGQFIDYAMVATARGILELATELEDRQGIRS